MKKVLILDYGSQYTQLIARRIRDLGIYSFIMPGDVSLARIQEYDPSAVILSGGPSSVYEKDAPSFAPEFLDFQKRSKLPVLGICYGLQLLVHHLGGKVNPGQHRGEFGKAKVIPTRESTLVGTSPRTAWMSHGDEVSQVPTGFTVVARSEAGTVAAVENPAAKIYALQFHPEVTHTENGGEILKYFLTQVAGLKPDWNMSSVIETQIAKIRAQVGSDDHAICALSGGVDSAVAATLVHQAIGDRLHCVFVDHGLMRLDEQKRVMKLFKDELGLPVECVDASDVFFTKLQGVTDPEQKRKIIGAEFIAVFREAANRLETTFKRRPQFLVQGTLYPDVIESSPATGTTGNKFSVTIKSHHNVGGLPKDLGFALIEPLRDLFKDEVRKLGAELKVPTAFLKRHPFPGPGLGVRILGEVTRARVEILQKVDEVFIQSLHEAGLYDQIWQAFAFFLPIRSVGVQGDFRTHDHMVGLRAVTSVDGMTADWFQFDPRFLAQVSTRICNEVRGVNRVVYDISSKPPATIELE